MQRFPISRINRIIDKRQCVSVQSTPVITSVNKRSAPERVQSEANRSRPLRPSSVGAHSTGSVPLAPRNSEEFQLLPEPHWIGNTQLDHPHTLETRKGIGMCNMCGFYEISTAPQLVMMCANRPSKIGKYNLQRWCQGQSPPPKVPWPDVSPANAARKIIWKSSD